MNPEPHIPNPASRTLHRDARVPPAPTARLATWFLFVTAGWILFRVPFLRAFYLYSVAEFVPGYVLAPLAGIYAGPAGVLGIVTGSLLGDGLTGQWGHMAGIRALGYGLSSLFAMRLWSRHPLPPTREGLLRFMLLCIPLSLTAAAWIALAGAWQRLYPFSYLLGLNTLNNLLSVLLLAPAGYWLLAVEWSPRFGDWSQNTGRIPPRTPRTEKIIWLGALAACTVGVVISGVVYEVWPFGHRYVGLHTGAWVTVPVLLTLLAQVAGFAWSFRTPPPPAPPTAGRFTSLLAP